MSAQILPSLMRSPGKEWRVMVTILTFLAWPSDSAKLRLVNGSHQCSGRVEVLFLLEYGTVCDDSWDLKEATVVCRNLDCGTAVFAARRAQFGQGSGLIWQDDVECTGNESSLSECQSKPVGSHNCHPEQDVGVVCSDNVRLVGGPNRCSGRVEVRALPSKQWRTICNRTWDIKDAEVVCRQLGCGKATSVPEGVHFGMGSSVILDDVHCNGTEDDIAQCIVQTEGNNGCHLGQEAGIVCSEPSTINIADVRLTGGSNSCAGKVEVLYQKQWGTVCWKDWDLQDAHVVCKQLGCGTALKAPQVADFRDRPGLIWLSNVTCMGHENFLQDCKGILTGEHECGHSEKANVVCTSAGYSPSNTSPWFLIFTLLFAIAFLIHEDAIALQN